MALASASLCCQGILLSRGLGALAPPALRRGPGALAPPALSRGLEALAPPALKRGPSGPWLFPPSGLLTASPCSPPTPGSAQWARKRPQAEVRVGELLVRLLPGPRQAQGSPLPRAEKLSLRLPVPLEGPGIGAPSSKRKQLLLHTRTPPSPGAGVLACACVSACSLLCARMRIARKWIARRVAVVVVAVVAPGGDFTLRDGTWPSQRALW